MLRICTLMILAGLGLGCGDPTLPPDDPPPPPPAKPPPAAPTPDPGQLPPLVEGIVPGPIMGMPLELHRQNFFVAHDHGARWVFSVTNARIRPSTLVDQTLAMVSDAGLGQATVTGFERLSDTLWFTVETTESPTVKEAWLTTQPIANSQARLTPTPQSAAHHPPPQQAKIAQMTFPLVRAALDPQDQARLDALSPLPPTAYRIYSPRLPQCGRLVLVSGEASSPSAAASLTLSALMCLDATAKTSMTIIAPAVDRQVSLVGFADLDGDGVDALVVEEDRLGSQGSLRGVRMGLYRWSSEDNALRRTELTDAEY